MPELICAVMVAEACTDCSFGCITPYTVQIVLDTEQVVRDSARSYQPLLPVCNRICLCILMLHISPCYTGTYDRERHGTCQTGDGVRRQEDVMPDFAAIAAELVRFGFNQTQAKVYLLLVSRPELRIQEIANQANMARSSVYDALKRLQERGVVEEIVDDNFKRYRAYPIGVLRHGIDERVLQLQQQSSDLDMLERTISLIDHETSGQAAVRFYTKRTGARQVLWNALKARSNVDVYSEWGRQKYVGLGFYERFVAESHRRGLTERVLINLTSATLDDIRRRNVPGSPAARTHVADVRVLDVRQADIKGDTLIYDDTYAQIYLKHVEIYGFEIQSEEFVHTQRSIFETLWRFAEPLDIYLA